MRALIPQAGRWGPLTTRPLLQPTHGPFLLGLHTPGSHIHNLDIRVPQAPVEAQVMAGVERGVRGRHGGP